MSSRPLVSIILPIFNGEKYLETAIKSVLSQEYANWELLLIDDGSSDNSQRIMRAQTDIRIKPVVHTSNQGLISTLNHGLTLARGQYIARMDQDDISDISRLNKQVKFLLENPDVGILGTQAAIINKDDRVQGILPAPIFSDDISFGLKITNCFIHGSVMFNRKALPDDIFYPSSYLHSEDYALWVKLANAGVKMRNLDEVLYFWRSHVESISKKENANQLVSHKEIVDSQKGKRAKTSADEIISFGWTAIRKLPRKIFVDGNFYRSNLQNNYQYILFLWAASSFKEFTFKSLLAFLLGLLVSPKKFLNILISRLSNSNVDA